MAKLELKGTFMRVLPIQTVGQKNTKKQSVIFKVPAYRDGFGDAYGEDEEYELQVLGERVDKLDLLSKNLQGKKAKVTIWINSKGVLINGEQRYIINASLASYELAPNQNAAAPVTTAESNPGDDFFKDM